MNSQLKSVLDIICQDYQLEAKWLHTLSLLEFIGARKIAKTMALHHPSSNVLDHFADETRHASIFKQLSQQLFATNEYLAENAAKTYMKKLDTQLCDWLDGIYPEATTQDKYLLVTTMIEERAMVVYPLYRKYSRDRQIQTELRKIIKEEASHQEVIKNATCHMLLPFHHEKLEGPMALEEQCFAEFLSTLDRELSITCNQRQH